MMMIKLKDFRSLQVVFPVRQAQAQTRENRDLLKVHCIVWASWQGPAKAKLSGQISAILIAASSQVLSKMKVEGEDE